MELADFFTYFPMPTGEIINGNEYPDLTILQFSMSAITFYKKNKATPPTARIAPETSLMVTFSLNKMTEGGMIKTGTRAIIVEAIPVEVS